MKPTTLCGGLLILVLVAFAGAAQANTACYDWSCNPDTHVCNFDSSCSTINQGTLWRYGWDFNNESTQLTSSTTIQYTFSTPYPYVALTLWTFGADEVSVKCQIVVWNAFGPPLPEYGQCPD